MPTDRFIQCSDAILLKIDRARKEYPSLWRGLIQEWQNCGKRDAAWLTYAASYLLNTASIKWALDPFSLITRVGHANQPDFLKDLESLQLVVFSHAHQDHLDLNIIGALRNLPITWVIPAFMLERVTNAAGLHREQILVPRAGNPIHFGDLTLTPFDGLHFRGTHGVPEMGYVAEFSGKRWLFPGDTRTYDTSRVPHFDALDGVFAHLWLGRGKALEVEPPLMEEFCQFFASLQPKQIVVTHLEELGRDADDFWDMSHYQKVFARFQEISSKIKVSASCMGQSVIL